MRIAEQQHDALLPACVALFAAVGAAALLQAATLAARAEGVPELLWLLGMVLGMWGAIATIAVAVLLWRRRGQPATATRASAALVTVAVAVLALTAWLYPIVGAGGGAG